MTRHALDPDESPWTMHTKQEVAEHLRVSLRTVDTYIHNGQLDAVDVGAGGQAYIRIRTGSVLKFEGVLPDWQPVPEYTGPKLVERAG